MSTSGTMSSPDAPPWWLRLTGTALGVLLVLYSLLSVPNEHRRYESYLERWWIWVEEKREHGLRWQAAFLEVILSVSNRAFDRIFGPRLFSLQAAAASMG